MFSRVEKWIRDYRLRHLSIGRIKQDKKKGYTDFHIEKISWDIHWLTHLYLAAIIRDYLRSFIKHTPAIGNCVIEDHKAFDHAKGEIYSKMSDEYWEKWKELVNSVADEFDELINLEAAIDSSDGDISDLLEKKKAMERKAFLDLAYIFDDLGW